MSKSITIIAMALLLIAGTAMAGPNLAKPPSVVEPIELPRFCEILLNLPFAKSIAGRADPWKRLVNNKATTDRIRAEQSALQSLEANGDSSLLSILDKVLEPLKVLGTHCGIVYYLNEDQVVGINLYGSVDDAGRMRALIQKAGIDDVILDVGSLREFEYAAVSAVIRSHEVLRGLVRENRLSKDKVKLIQAVLNREILNPRVLSYFIEVKGIDHSTKHRFNVHKRYFVVNLPFQNEVYP